jgi:hypothetical protein
MLHEHRMRSFAHLSTRKQTGNAVVVKNVSIAVALQKSLALAGIEGIA